MSGWDRDEGGDYTPAPVPRWIWRAVAALILGLFALAVLLSQGSAA